MTSINPGEEKLYEWTADYAGVWMYHCGTAPALHHIANGMYGMVIVEPKGGLPKVDQEFALVQSEWYLGPQGAARSPDQGLGRGAGAGLRRLQRRRQPVQGPPARGRHRRDGPDLRPRRRPEHRQLVPHRRHDLQHGHQGRHPAGPRQRGQLGLAGRGPVAGPGRDRRVHDGRGRPLPDRHPRLQLRRTRRPRPVQGRRRRPAELASTWGAPFLICPGRPPRPCWEGPGPPGPTPTPTETHRDTRGPPPGGAPHRARGGRPGE